MSDGQVEWFQATGNKVWGIVAIAFGLGFGVITLIYAHSPVWPLVGLLFALLCYASMWRPRVGASADELVLKAMYSTQTIPLAAIDSIIITRTLAARVIGRNYISSALGRGQRELMRSRRRFADGGPPRDSYADLVEQRLEALVVDARRRTGVEQGSVGQSALAQQIRRTWAWPEVALSVVVTVALVIAILL